MPVFHQRSRARAFQTTLMLEFLAPVAIYHRRRHRHQQHHDLFIIIHELYGI